MTVKGRDPARQAGRGQQVDGADALLLTGLLLIGLAVVLVWGWAALAAYVGTVLVIFGIVLAIVRGRR